MIGPKIIRINYIFFVVLKGQKPERKQNQKTLEKHKTLP